MRDPMKIIAFLSIFVIVGIGVSFLIYGTLFHSHDIPVYISGKNRWRS